MKKIKEVIVYCEGDSRDLLTWSNVPYFLTNELEKRGIEVHRVDINFDKNSSLFSWLYYYLCRIIRIIIILIHKNKKTIWNFDFTRYCEISKCKIMKEARSKYPNADLQIGITLSYVIKNDIPFISFGDWTIEYCLENRFNRKPFNIEKRLINNQHKMLEKSDAIVSLMPRSKDSLSSVFKDKVYYFGTGVNAVNKYVDLSYKKSKSNNILFIGNYKYKSGLETLIKAVKECDKLYNINVIGINANEYKGEKNNCTFYGYLNKGVKQECEKYYELMNDAKIVVNLTEKWNGISSLLESLYYGIPIIITNNIEVESIIGIDKSFCKIINDNASINDIALEIEKYMKLDNEQYKIISKEAHYFVKKHMWNIIVDGIMELGKKL